MEAIELENRKLLVHILDPENHIREKDDVDDGLLWGIEKLSI